MRTNIDRKAHLNDATVPKLSIFIGIWICNSRLSRYLVWGHYKMYLRALWDNCGVFGIEQQMENTDSFFSSSVFCGTAKANIEAVFNHGFKIYAVTWTIAVRIKLR